MNLLVTGGAGYVGSHACKALHAAGYTPISYDNLACGHEWAVKWGPLVKGDLAETDRLVEVIRSYGISAVLHFAASAYVGESMLRPDLYYTNNVLGTLSLLKAMQRTGVSRLVFSSSCAVYGIPDRLPITEGQPLDPVSPYGFSKLVAERMIRDFGTAFGIRSVALRYFNAAGADPGLLIGECHAAESHLIPLAIAAALGKEPPLTVHGCDYPTNDGTCVRDYVHVEDLAAAHVAALRHLESGEPLPLGSHFNLGSSRGHSVREVIDSVQRVSGRVVPHELGPRRQGDPPILVADSSKARRDLGWAPRYGEIDAIVASAFRWFTSLHPESLTGEGA